MLRVVALLLALLPSLACAQGNPALVSGAPQPFLDCNFTARVSYNTATNTLSAGPRCPPVLFNRASPKYDISCNGGVLTTFAPDVPAVPACALGTGHPLGLGIEGMAVIVNSHARDLTQSAWIKHGTTAALTEKGLDGTANSASLLTASASNGTTCNGTTANALQRVISIYLKRVTGVGEVDISPDGANWTNVTASLTSKGYTRLPAGGLYFISTSARICLRLVAAGDAIAVDFANEEYDPRGWNVAPTTPVLTAAAGFVTREQDNAWIDLAAVSGWNPDRWTIVLREMIPTWIVPPGYDDTTLGRALLQVDDGTGINAWHALNQQDPGADRLCWGPGTILHCPDFALIGYQNGSQIRPGKVRATLLPDNQLAGLAPPGAGYFSVVAISYDRNLGNAMTVDTGGPPTTLSNGRYFPSGRMPTISSEVSPQFAAGVFKRLVLGGAPDEMAVLGGSATANDVLTLAASWEHPQTTRQTASISYTVRPGDTPASMATALAAAINANTTLAASGITATSRGVDVFPAHPSALFVGWHTSVTGARTEILVTNSHVSNLWGYIQQVQVYNVALRGTDLMQALLPTTRSR